MSVLGLDAGRVADPHAYLAHYGLRAVPFGPTADPRRLWLGRTHRAALDRLTVATRDGDGILVLTGDVGTGKTSLANGLAERLRDAGLLVGELTMNARFEASEFFQAIMTAIRRTGTFDVNDDFVTAPEESWVAGACLGVLLDRATSAGRKVILIIDEAQCLSEDLLRETAELSGLASTSESSLVILLIGQKELNALLSDPRNEALTHRVAARFTLEPLERDEVSGYIRHCLATAGAQFEIFTADATQEIATLSRGAPRAINMLCEHALLTGREQGARTITRETVLDSSWRAQLEIRPGRAGVRLIGLHRPHRAGAARRRRGWLGTEVMRGILKTLVRGGPTVSIVLGAGILLLAGGYSLYAGRLGGMRREPPSQPAAHAPLAVKPAPDHVPPGAPRTATPPSELTPGQPPGLPSATLGVTEAPSERAAPVPESTAPAPSILPVRLKTPTVKRAALRERDTASESTATPPAKTAGPREYDLSLESKVSSPPVAHEERNEPPQRPSALADPLQPRRGRETPDPGDIVDWFLKEYSPAKRSR